jgi:hypothetical protein
LLEIIKSLIEVIKFVQNKINGIFLKTYLSMHGSTWCFRAAVALGAAEQGRIGLDELDEAQAGAVAHGILLVARHVDGRHPGELGREQRSRDVGRFLATVHKKIK